MLLIILTVIYKKTQFKNYKTISRAKAKDTFLHKGMPNNPFSSFNSSDDSLIDLSKRLGVDLGNSNEKIKESLNMIKDLEIARYNLLDNSVNSSVVCDSETIHPILDSDDLVDRNFQDFSDFNSDLKKMEKKLSRKGRNKNLQKTSTKKKNKTSPKIKCTPNKRGRTRDECSSFNSS